MKLDQDFVREILLAIEANDESVMSWIELNMPERDERDISYHLMLLNEAGFIVAIDLSTMDGVDWKPRRLTYKGHEFLDTIRDGEVWRRTKAGAEKAGVASIGVVWELAKAYGKQVVTERLGIDLG